jgi:nucleotide-binding universal stress UspA family protein
MSAAAATPGRNSIHPPFPRILCAIDGRESVTAAVEQAIAVAGEDSRIVFAALRDAPSRAAVDQARARAGQARVQARSLILDAPRLGDALLGVAAEHDLVVVGAHTHARATGIVLGETATLLLHRCPVPVLVARERPLAAGIVAATRALPADRGALTAATHLARRLHAALTVVHVAEPDEERRTPELKAELANARAFLGREIDFVRETGAVARGIVVTTAGDGAGLVVVGSRGRLGLPALASVSERVAHQAPCSVLVMRGA